MATQTLECGWLHSIYDWTCCSAQGEKSHIDAYYTYDYGVLDVRWFHGVSAFPCARAYREFRNAAVQTLECGCQLDTW